jgi:rSAM-associated Gly-rich repeat protein
MKNTSLTKSLPALLALTGGAMITSSGKTEAANTASQGSSDLDKLEARIKNVHGKLATEQPGLAFDERTSVDGLSTFWWGNRRNGGWGPGMWHNWGNRGWRNWGNGWGQRWLAQLAQLGQLVTWLPASWRTPRETARIR